MTSSGEWLNGLSDGLYMRDLVIKMRKWAARQMPDVMTTITAIRAAKLLGIIYIELVPSFQKSKSNKTNVVTL